MTQRDLIAAALKILGLCLVVVGVVQASTSVFGACIANKAIRVEISQQQAHPKESMAYQTHMLPMYQMQQASNMFMAGFRILQVLTGLYFCKGGTAVLNFLVGKPTDTSPPSI